MYLKFYLHIYVLFSGVIGCGYFCKERFSDEIAEFVKYFIPATRILWQETKVTEFCLLCFRCKWNYLSLHLSAFLCFKTVLNALIITKFN